MGSRCAGRNNITGKGRADELTGADDGRFAWGGSSEKTGKLILAGVEDRRRPTRTALAETRATPVNLRWTPDGRLVCGKCGTEGHVMRDCPKFNRQQQMDFGCIPDGQFVCYGCSVAGQIQWFCPGGRQPGPSSQRRQSGVDQQLIGLVRKENRNTEEKVWPVLKIDFKRLVVQDVFCGGRHIPALIDTGEAVSVFFPKLVGKLNPFSTDGTFFFDGFQ